MNGTYVSRLRVVGAGRQRGIVRTPFEPTILTGGGSGVRPAGGRLSQLAARNFVIGGPVAAGNAHRVDFLISEAACWEAELSNSTFEVRLSG